MPYGFYDLTMIDYRCYKEGIPVGSENVSMDWLPLMI